MSQTVADLVLYATNSVCVQEVGDLTGDVRLLMHAQKLLPNGKISCEYVICMPRKDTCKHQEQSNFLSGYV